MSGTIVKPLQNKSSDANKLQKTSAAIMNNEIRDSKIEAND